MTIWTYPLSFEDILDCLPARGPDAAVDLELPNQKLYGALMQPPITIGYTCDWQWPSPVTGKYLAWSHPFILPYIGGPWQIYWYLRSMAPSSTNPLHIMEWDSDYWSTSNTSIYDDNSTSNEMFNDVCLIWPMRACNSVAAITSSNVIQLRFSDWDEYEAYAHENTFLCDGDTHQFPPYIPSDGAGPLGAVFPKRLAEWCNKLLYTPLYLWGHNSAPRASLSAIQTGTIRYSSNAFAVPSGNVSHEVFKLCHWVPYRWGCPDFCNTLKIYVLTCQDYQTETLNAPVIRVSIGGQEYEKTMTLLMTTEDDTLFGLHYVYEATFPPPTGLETSILIGGRPFWPVQVIKFQHLDSKGNSLTQTIQSCAAWLGGR